MCSRHGSELSGDSPRACPIPGEGSNFVMIHFLSIIPTTRMFTELCSMKLPEFVSRSTRTHTGQSDASICFSYLPFYDDLTQKHSSADGLRAR